MALPQLHCLEPGDILKLLQFQATLLQNTDDFIAVTLKSLHELFDYPISTYTIFDDDMNGNRYIRENHSNYFSPSELTFYDNKCRKSDSSYQNSKIDWANNSSKYIFITWFDPDSTNPYEQAMREKGIKCQIRLGSHSRASTPIHVLSIYQPLCSDPLNEYETLLLSAIGQIFSSCVGCFKAYERAHKSIDMYAHYLDEESNGVAFFDPCGNRLNYNKAFPAYAAWLSPEKAIPELVNELIADHHKSLGSAPLQLQPTSSTEINGCLVTVAEKQLSYHHNRLPYYLITISTQGSASHEKGTKSAAHRWQSVYHLTTREIEVAQLIDEGLNNTEIAERLIISMPTVKTHIKNIFSKFGVTSRAALIERLQD